VPAKLTPLSFLGQENHTQEGFLKSSLYHFTTLPRDHTSKKKTKDLETKKTATFTGCGLKTQIDSEMTNEIKMVYNLYFLAFAQPL